MDHADWLFSLSSIGVDVSLFVPLAYPRTLVRDIV
jgi:hypothetical protein